MKAGDKVRVRAYGGVVLERRAVRADERMVYVTTEQEYRAALREGRKPDAVGFFKEALVI
jgi:hypothetical protein